MPFVARSRLLAKPGTSGLGMGLAIAKGIVEAHGGRIWVDPVSNGRGARIVFTVPVGDEAADRSIEPHNSQPELLSA